MASPSPLGVPELTDEYFIENRNRLLEIAAFLDRLDRADAGRTRADFRIRAFREALAALPEDQRTAFLLFEESGLGLKEIAEVTGVPAETVKSRLRYALAKLRRALADDFGMTALRPARAEL